MNNQKHRGASSGLLDEALGRTPHVKVLRYLCRTGGEHTGRAISRAIQVSHPAVHRAMRTLVQRGIVQSLRHGPAISYRLNEDHWLVQTGLRPLFEGEANFLTAIGDAVRKVAGVPMRSVIVFGSVARGEATAASDLDLLCLTEKVTARAEAEQNLADKAAILRRRFGRRLSVMVLPAVEFARRYRGREQLAREIVDTGWVVAGDPLGEVLR